MFLQFFTAKSSEDLKRCYPVMKELRWARLLTHAEGLAKQNGCKVLRLCTGIENERGMKFYEKNNWIQRAYAYTKKLG